MKKAKLSTDELDKLVRAAGMESNLFMGSGSCVNSVGMTAVSQADLEKFVELLIHHVAGELHQVVNDVPVALAGHAITLDGYGRFKCSACGASAAERAIAHRGECAYLGQLLAQTRLQRIARTSK